MAGCVESRIIQIDDKKKKIKLHKEESNLTVGVLPTFKFLSVRK